MLAQTKTKTILEIKEIRGMIEDTPKSLLKINTSSSSLQEKSREEAETTETATLLRTLKGNHRSPKKKRRKPISNLWTSLRENSRTT